MATRVDFYAKFAWLFGFFALKGLKYFTTGDPTTLLYFAFVGFFGFLFTGKLAMERPDERYYENRQKAKAIAMFVPAIALFIVGFSSLLPFGTRDFMILGCALGWAATFLTYSIALYYFEKH